MSLADLHYPSVLRVVRVARKTLKMPEHYNINDELVISDYGDSLSKIEFICELEREFGVEISDDQTESCVTFADVVRLLQP